MGGEGASRVLEELVPPRTVYLRGQTSLLVLRLRAKIIFKL